MKKTNILKIFMTLVLAFVITGAFAQLNDPAGDYNSTVTEAAHQVTLGATMPFWVEPDSYFNPDFEAAVNALTGDPLQDYMDDADKTEVVTAFAWDITELTPYTPAVVRENYVEITFSTGNGFAAGTDYTLTVQETAGGCPGTAVNMTVSVVAQPSMTTIGTPAADIDECEGDPALTTAINATLAGQAGNMNLRWDYKAYTVLSSWDGVTYPIPSGDIDDADISAVAGYIVADNPTAASPFVGANGAANALAASREYISYQGKITVYEFELISVNDRVSRRSDYLSIFTGSLDDTAPESYTYYTNGAMSRYIVVRPAPTTGPIYHISNNWGL